MLNQEPYCKCNLGSLWSSIGYFLNKFQQLLTTVIIEIWKHGEIAKTKIRQGKKQERPEK